MSNDTSNHVIKISEGITLAALPAIAYAIAYRYEVGFCSTYRIPTHYIEVTITSVLSALAVLVAGLSATFWIANLIYMLTSRTAMNTPLGRANAFSLFITLFLFTIILISWPPSWVEFVIAAVLMTFIAIQYVWPLFTQRDKPTYSEKLQGQEEIERQFESIFDLMYRKVGRNIYLMLWVIFVLLLLANVAGRGQARRQRLFLASVANPQMVVLRQYGGNYITCRLANDMKTTTTEFRVMSVAGTDLSESHAFALVRIGPLQIGDIPSSLPIDRIQETSQPDEPASRDRP